MAYLGLQKNGTILVPNLREGITTEIIIDSTSTLKAKLTNTCEGTVEAMLIEPGSYTLNNGIFTKSFEINLNCGKLSGSVTLSTENGLLRCTVLENSNFSHDFIQSTVEGFLNFSSIVQVNSYSFTVTPNSYATITIKRNGNVITTNDVLSGGDVLTITATETNSTYGIKYISVNGTNYTNPATITVNSDLTIEAITAAKVWVALYNGSRTLSHGSSMTIDGLKANVKTRFTTGTGSIYYYTLDGCDNDCGSGSKNINARTDYVSENGILSGSNTDSGISLYFGFTLKANTNELSFSAFANGSYDMGNYMHHFDGAQIVVKKIEQMGIPVDENGV